MWIAFSWSMQTVVHTVFQNHTKIWYNNSIFLFGVFLNLDFAIVLLFITCLKASIDKNKIYNNLFIMSDDYFLVLKR